MRAHIIAAGLLVLAACSPDRDRSEAPVDDFATPPELALHPPDGGVPVASDVETNQPEEPALPDARNPVDGPDTPEPLPEPIDATPHAGSVATATPVATAEHAHPATDDAGGIDAESPVEGGGKPTGVSTGLGPVPDRNWGDPTIIDDPDPVPGTIGGNGGVITRGGPGRIDDDCARHPRGGVVGGGMPMPAGPAVLVNDRDPRRGAAINERAPRATSRPSLPRGGGLPGGGGIRGGIR